MNELNFEALVNMANLDLDFSANDADLRALTEEEREVEKTDSLIRLIKVWN